METVSITIPKQFLNEVLNFVYSLCQNPPNQSLTVTEIETIKFSSDDIQSSAKFCESQYDEQNLIEQLKSLGIKYSEVKRYCKQYPENVNIGIERAGKPGTKNPTAMFIATLKNPGEIIKTGDRLAVSNAPTAISSIQSHQHQAQLMQIKQLVIEHKELIEYKAGEWKVSKAFAHKDIEMVQADVISSYINDPVRFELDKIAFKAIKQRQQQQAEREAVERQRLADIDKELDNISQEKSQANLNKLRLALNKALFNSQQFARKKEEVEF